MDVTWRKSTRSNSQGDNCVEVAELPDRVLLRDSTLGDAGPVLSVTRQDFQRLIATLHLPGQQGDGA